MVVDGGECPPGADRPVLPRPAPRARRALPPPAQERHPRLRRAADRQPALAGPVPHGRRLPRFHEDDDRRGGHHPAGGLPRHPQLRGAEREREAGLQGAARDPARDRQEHQAARPLRQPARPAVGGRRARALQRLHDPGAGQGAGAARRQGRDFPPRLHPGNRHRGQGGGGDRERTREAPELALRRGHPRARSGGPGAHPGQRHALGEHLGSAVAARQRLQMPAHPGRVQRSGDWRAQGVVGGPLSALLHRRRAQADVCRRPGARVQHGVPVRGDRRPRATVPRRHEARRAQGARLGAGLCDV